MLTGVCSFADRWNVVFHDSSPRFAVLNELAAWAKEHIKERPFKFGHVDVEANKDLASALDIDYVPLMLTIADGQVRTKKTKKETCVCLSSFLRSGS